MRYTMWRYLHISMYMFIYFLHIATSILLNKHSVKRRENSHLRKNERHSITYFVPVILLLQVTRDLTLVQQNSCKTHINNNRLIMSAVSDLQLFWPVSGMSHKHLPIDVSSLLCQTHVPTTFHMWNRLWTKEPLAACQPNDAWWCTSV